jgi:hypothetical protein
MAGAKIVRRVSNMGRGCSNPAEDELPYDEWIPAHAVKFRADGLVEILTEAGQSHAGTPNVEGGVFHPIRWGSLAGGANPARKRRR